MTKDEQPRGDALQSGPAVLPARCAPRARRSTHRDAARARSSSQSARRVFSPLGRRVARELARAHELGRTRERRPWVIRDGRTRAVLRRPRGAPSAARTTRIDENDEKNRFASNASRGGFRIRGFVRGFEESVCSSRGPQAAPGGGERRGRGQPKGAGGARPLGW